MASSENSNLMGKKKKKRSEGEGEESEAPAFLESWCTTTTLEEQSVQDGNLQRGMGELSVRLSTP